MAKKSRPIDHMVVRVKNLPKRKIPTKSLHYWKLHHTTLDSFRHGAASILNGAALGARRARNPWVEDLKALQRDQQAVADDFYRAMRWADSELEDQQLKLFEPNKK